MLLKHSTSPPLEEDIQIEFLPVMFSGAEVREQQQESSIGTRICKFHFLPLSGTVKGSGKDSTLNLFQVLDTGFPRN